MQELARLLREIEDGKLEATPRGDVGVAFGSIQSGGGSIGLAYRRTESGYSLGDDTRDFLVRLIEISEHAGAVGGFGDSASRAPS